MLDIEHLQATYKDAHDQPVNIPWLLGFFEIIDDFWPAIYKELVAGRRLAEEINKETESKNQAYKERNALVALLSKLWPSHLAKHPESDETWERDWMNIVCIHAPVGQLTWHLHDSDIPMFAHLAFEPGHWDGHTTEEKYARIATWEREVKGE